MMNGETERYMRSFFFAFITTPIIERQKGEIMRDTQLDFAKMTEEERNLYKTYVEGLRELKIRTFEEDMKELDDRWNSYKNGEIRNASRVYAMTSSMKRLLEELMEHDEDLSDIEDLEEAEDRF